MKGRHWNLKIVDKYRNHQKGDTGYPKGVESWTQTPNIFAICCSRYQTFTPLGFINIGIRKLKFEAKTQFLFSHPNLLFSIFLRSPLPLHTPPCLFTNLVSIRKKWPCIIFESDLIGELWLILFLYSAGYRQLRYFLWRLEHPCLPKLGWMNGKEIIKKNSFPPNHN